MQNLKEEIKKEIQKQRPNLSDSSLKTYMSLLITLCRKLKFNNIDDLKADPNVTLAYIDTLSSVQSKKTILSACYILTEDMAFKTKMLEYCAETNDKYKEQRLSKSRETINFSFDDVKRIYGELIKKLKNSPTIENYVNYIIASLMSGVIDGIAPRRLEYCDVKIKDFDKATDNYLDLKNNCIILNKYKTAKNYGQAKIMLPKVLLSVIKKFLKINPSDYLLIHSNNKPFNASELSKQLQRIYGDKVGCDMLRSTFLSNFYKDMPAIQKMDDLARQMSHSVTSALNYYVKK